MKKTDKYTIRKRKSILIACSDNWYSSLILPKFNKGYFLKGWLQCSIWNRINELFCYTLKSTGLTGMLNDFYLSMIYYYALVILKILVNWVTQIFQMLHFIIQYKKIILINITSNLIRKVFKCWEATKFMFCVVQILSLTTPKIGCFPWSDSSFLRKCLPNTRVWITKACQSILKVKIVFYKTDPVQLATQKIMSTLPWDNHHTDFPFCPT